MTDGQLIVHGEPSPFPSIPAVYFACIESGEDEKGLLGRVKTMAQLEELEVEQIQQSALIGETAYRLEPGFVISLASPKEAQPSAGASEAELLAAFILDKLH